MEQNNLKLSDPINCFSDEQIRNAMSEMGGNTPVYYAMGLIGAMGDFIIYNQNIDKHIRETYSVMDQNLSFYLDLIKEVIGKD